MRLSNKYGGLQFFAPAPELGTTYIYVNSVFTGINIKNGIRFSINADNNATRYTIDSNNQVVWNDGKFLAYNGVIVLGSDEIVANRYYTTVEGGGRVQ